MKEEEIEKVAEEVTENAEVETAEEIDTGIELTDTSEVEETTDEKEEEQKGRFMTDEEIDKLVMKKVNRRMAKYEAKREKELETYKDIGNVLKVGMETDDLNEARDLLRKGYEEQGYKLPETYKTGLSEKQIEILAKAEAKEIEDDGYDAMVEEANRLADKKYENLNRQEQIVFSTLASKLTEINENKALAKLGVDKDILKSDEFVDFRKQFNSNTPVDKIYDLYQKTKQPEKEKPKMMGSMKTTTKEPAVKDFYTYEESLQFTREDFDKNPALFKAIEKSMSKW